MARILRCLAFMFLLGNPVAHSGPNGVEGVVLKRAKPAHFVERSNGEVKYSHDMRMDLDEAAALKKAFPKASNIESVPGRKDLFIIMRGVDPSTEEDYGPCVALVLKAAEGFRELGHTRGFMDTGSMDLYFFTGGKRAILFCETKDQCSGESWGFHLYEVDRKSMRELGELEVSKSIQDPNEDDTALPSRVLTVGKGIRLEYKEALILHLRDSAKGVKRILSLKTKGKGPIVFNIKDGGAVLVESSCEITSTQEYKLGRVE